MAYGEKGPRPLRPAVQDRFLFPMTKENGETMVKGIVAPTTTRGAINGVMPGCRAARIKLLLNLEKAAAALKAAPLPAQKAMDEEEDEKKGVRLIPDNGPTSKATPINLPVSKGMPTPQGSPLHQGVHEADHPHSPFHPPMTSFTSHASGGVGEVPHGVQAAKQAAHHHALHVLHSGQAALAREQKKHALARYHEIKSDHHHTEAHKHHGKAFGDHAVSQAHHDLADYHLHRAIQTKGKEAKTHRLMAFAHHQAKQKPSHGGKVGHHEMASNMIWGHRKIFGSGKAGKPESIKEKAGAKAKYHPSRWFGARETGLAYGGEDQPQLERSCAAFMSQLMLKAAKAYAVGGEAPMPKPGAADPGRPAKPSFKPSKQRGIEMTSAGRFETKQQKPHGFDWGGGKVKETAGGELTPSKKQQPAAPAAAPAKPGGGKPGLVSKVGSGALGVATQMMGTARTMGR